MKNRFLTTGFFLMLLIFLFLFMPLILGWCVCLGIFLKSWGILSHHKNEPYTFSYGGKKYCSINWIVNDTAQKHCIADIKRYLEIHKVDSEVTSKTYPRIRNIYLCKNDNILNIYELVVWYLSSQDGHKTKEDELERFVCEKFGKNVVAYSVCLA